MREEIKNVLDKHGIYEENSWVIIILLLILGSNINDSKKLENLLTKIENNEIDSIKKEMSNNEQPNANY